MKIEHIGYMVKDPVKTAQWYATHLGMRIVRQMSESPFTHFLADSSGQMMLEIYNNPKAAVPDYASMDPLVLHVAFVTDDVPAARKQLLDAGAKPEGAVIVTPSGDTLAMLRDPWGMPIQLAKRGEPMI